MPIVASRLTSTGSLFISGEFQEGIGSVQNTNSSSLLNSINFNGINQYLSVPNNAAFKFGTGNFTVEWWWYLTVPFVNQEGPAIGMVLNADANGGWVIYRDTSHDSDRINFRMLGSGGRPDINECVTTITPSTNVWQHWAAVRNGTTFTWYCDGTPCGVYTGINTNITDTLATRSSLYIGWAPTWDYFIPGYISNLRIVKGSAVYTGAFTPSRPLTAVAGTSLLLTMSNSATPYQDSSLNNFTVTPVNGPLFSGSTGSNIISLTTTSYSASEFDEISIQGSGVAKRETINYTVMISGEFNEVNKPI